MSGLYLEYSYPFESLQSARGYRRNSFHLQTLRFCFFISWHMMPNLSFLTQPDDCAPVVTTFLYLGVSDAYTCACFLTYSIRSIFSLCWAQLFFCVTMFYDYGIQGLPPHPGLWSPLENILGEFGLVDGFIELGWRLWQDLPGTPRRQRKYDCCAGQPERTEPSFSMYPWPILPIVLKFKKAILV